MRPHKHIVAFYGTCNDPLSIVTEFISNGSLYDLLHSSTKISEDYMIKIAYGIAAAMLHLHKEGTIHRDLAARNVLLDENGNAKVTDFGLSRILYQGTYANKTYMGTGPLKWMAPECLQDKIYSRKSDVWSYGVLLYELISRSDPYYDMDMIQCSLKVCNQQIALKDYLQRDNISTPTILVKLMKKCLVFKSKHRPHFDTIVEILDVGSSFEMNPP